MRVYRGDELARSLDEIVAARFATIAFGEGGLAGDAAAALMFSSWAVLAHDASLIIDTPAAWAGAVWRMGDQAMALLALDRSLPAKAALRLGLCDAVGEEREFPGRRSEVALDAAAALMAGRGGDALELATFAWLFATGVPAEGLTAFLEKRGPRFAAGSE